MERHSTIEEEVQGHGSTLNITGEILFCNYPVHVGYGAQFCCP